MFVYGGIDSGENVLSEMMIFNLSILGIFIRSIYMETSQESSRLWVGLSLHDQLSLWSWQKATRRNEGLDLHFRWQER